MWTSYIIMSLTFITAYNSTDKEVCININKYGEANFELIVMVIIGNIITTLTTGTILYRIYKKLVRI